MRWSDSQRSDSLGVIGRAERQQCPEDRQRGVGQRHPVFPLGLHPLRRHRPDRFGEVDFLPPGAQCLIRARRGQDGEFQGARAHALPAAQIGQEGSGVLPGQCGMVRRLSTPIRNYGDVFPGPGLRGEAL